MATPETTPGNETPFFRVNGREYPMPTDLTLGEMCDAERYFGVEFGENATSGMRMAAALLWIAIQREDKSVTVDDIRELPLDVFAEAMGDASPPPPGNDSGSNENSESSGDDSETSGNGRVDDPSFTGVPS